MAVHLDNNIKLYDSIENMPIYNFDKVMSGDFRYMAKTDDVNIVEINEVYKNTWDSLYNEYAKKTKNNTLIAIYLLKGEINYLSLRFTVVPMLLDTVLSTTDQENFENAIQELINWGFRINKDNTLEEEIPKVIKSLNNSQNKLNRKKAELKELVGEKTPMTLSKQHVRLQTILGRSLRSTKEITVEEWLDLWDEVDVIKKSNKKVE